MPALRRRRPTDAPSADAPWILTRLRAAPGATLALSVLVLVTAFLAAALPRAVDVHEDTALRDTVAEARVAERSVTASLDVSWLSFPRNADAHVTPASLAAAEEAFQSLVRPPLALDERQAVHGVRTARAVPATDPYLDRPTPYVDPRATVVAQPDLGRHTRVVAGRLPRPRSAAGSVEAAVTAGTARVMGIRAGSEVHLAEEGGAGLTLRITGVVRPRSPEAAYWNAEPELRAPKLHALPDENPKYYWRFTALVDDRAAGVLLDLGEGVTAYWHHPADTDALTARTATALVDRIAAFNGGPEAARLQRLGLRGLTVEEEGLATLVAPFARERAAVAPLITVAAAGVGTVAVIVLLMAAELAVARRRTELVLLRARGASLRGLAARLLGESAVTAVPAAAAGLLLALLLVPTQRSAAAVWAAVAVAVVASLALPVRALLSARTLRPGEPEDLVRARPSRRRTVAELTVVLVVTGAVPALRRRGTADGGLDPLIAAAPVLVALVAAVLLLRLYPLPLRLLARPAARLRGAVLPLGVARAGRAPVTATLPLLAVLVALTVTSFGGAVLSGVAEGRDRAALLAVGADARIQAPTTVPSGLAERVRRLGGVRDVAAVRIEPDLRVEQGGTAFDLLMVDPASYARLAAATGVDDRFPAAALDDDRDAGALAAVVSPRLAEEFGRAPHTLRTVSGLLDVRAAATRDAAAAAPGRNFVVVSTHAVARTRPDLLRTTTSLDPTALYVTGDGVDGESLRAAAQQASAGLTVYLRSQERQALKGTALQSGAQRVYLAVVVAGGGYCALALLLSLLQSAPQRRTTLARLRTMGMRRRQRQWLAVIEVLPQVLLGAVGGMLTGLAVVPLLRPGVDLTVLTFTGRPPADAPAPVLDTDPVALVLPSVGLVTVACAVLAAQVWLTGRRGEGANLRMGDQT
ncbi:FtsX-like permease family protein [Streptomyces sp. NPDC002845]